MRAARLDAVGRGCEDFLGTCFVEMPMRAHQARTHPFARQSVRHEHGLALDVRDATPVVRQIVDRGFKKWFARIRHPRILPDASSDPVQNAPSSAAAA
jgi:hypothetical protein